MLWDLIREFFVKHIFGGSILEGGYTLFYGGLFGADPLEEIGTYSMQETYFTFDNILFWGENVRISVGDYLSTLATIISITIIVVLCCLFIKKIINLVGGLIR